MDEAAGGRRKNKFVLAGWTTKLPTLEFVGELARHIQRPATAQSHHRGPGLGSGHYLENNNLRFK
jgi:hypothetical protein